MNKKICRIISVLLALALLLHSGVFAVNPNERLESDSAEYMQESPRTREVDLEDVFDIYYVPGVPYEGYIFRLADTAIVPFGFSENEAIDEIYGPKNMFVADTLEDIEAIVDPELILYIEPDYKTFLPDLSEAEFRAQ